MKNNPTALKSALLVSLLSFGTALSAETTTSTTSTERHSAAANANSTKLKGSDRNFIEKAARNGMKEVSVSQTAMDRLMNPQVKEFAQMLVMEHSAVNTELMALATAKGVVLPVKDMKHDEKWSKKNKGVDKDYMDEMVSDHKDSVDLFEKAAKSEDADIAAFARKMLPKLQHHHMMAKDLQKAVK